MPNVSVIIPVYNGAATVGRALASVFAQTFTDYEVVVVDDGSTDDSLAVLAGYGEKIRVVKRVNGGPSAARNAGVRESHTEYLAFLDADDEWMPEKLARSVPLLGADPDCALVYTRAMKFDLQGRQVGTMDRQSDFAESPTMAEMLERVWNVVPSQMLVRRDAFERCGGFEERLRAFEDPFFLLRVREQGHFRRVDEVLMLRVVRPLFPDALEREPHCDQFVALVRERYGASSGGLVRELWRERAALMKQMARELIKQGRREDARRCLARVIHYEPASPNAYLKYLKTFLPRRVDAAASPTEGTAS